MRWKAQGQIALTKDGKVKACDLVKLPYLKSVLLTYRLIICEKLKLFTAQDSVI
jgi:hypothetical protein